MLSFRGQTLVEVVVAVGIAVLVVGALTVAATNSIRNAQLSRNQTQATRLAQDATEQARAMRDTLGFDGFAAAGGSLFGSDPTTPGLCVEFDLSTHTVANAGTGREIPGATTYTRCVQVYPTTAGANDSLSVHVRVRWTDALGDHDPGSELETRLTKWE